VPFSALIGRAHSLAQQGQGAGRYARPIPARRHASADRERGAWCWVVLGDKFGELRMQGVQDQSWVIAKCFLILGAASWFDRVYP
jgi:hypothetical protein